MKFLLHTYGCQMNVRDSEAVEALLVAAGHEKVETEAEAEVVIVNSCTVRQKAEEKAVGKAIYSLPARSSDSWAARSNAWGRMSLSDFQSSISRWARGASD